MKVTISKRQISPMRPFSELVSFDGHNADIKSDSELTQNLSQHSVNGKKVRTYSVKTVPSFSTLLAHQNEIKKLQGKIKQLESEKSILVKWIHFLF